MRVLLLTQPRPRCDDCSQHVYSLSPQVEDTLASGSQEPCDSFPSSFFFFFPGGIVSYMPHLFFFNFHYLKTTLKEKANTLQQNSILNEILSTNGKGCYYNNYLGAG